MRQVLTNWQILAAAGAAVLLAAGGALYWWRHRPADPEEIERQRRSHLNQVGRIIEGQVIEIAEAAPPQPSGGALQLDRKRAARAADNTSTRRRLVWYSYSISGVTYETAQDVTGLEERACLDRLVAGQPASVKYDPANPSNSILVADDWSGLR